MRPLDTTILESSNGRTFSSIRRCKSGSEDYIYCTLHLGIEREMNFNTLAIQILSMFFLPKQKLIRRSLLLHVEIKVRRGREGREKQRYRDGETICH